MVAKASILPPHGNTHQFIRTPLYEMVVDAIQNLITHFQQMSCFSFCSEDLLTHQLNTFVVVTLSANKHNNTPLSGYARAAVGQAFRVQTLHPS